MDVGVVDMGLMNTMMQIVFVENRGWNQKYRMVFAALGFHQRDQKDL